MKGKVVSLKFIIAISAYIFIFIGMTYTGIKGFGSTISNEWRGYDESEKGLFILLCLVCSYAQCYVGYSMYRELSDWFLKEIGKEKKRR